MTPDTTAAVTPFIDPAQLDYIIQGALGMATWFVTNRLSKFIFWESLTKWVDTTYIVAGVAILVGLAGSAIAGYPVGSTAVTIVTAILAQRTIKHVPRVVENLK